MTYFKRLRYSKILYGHIGKITTVGKVFINPNTGRRYFKIWYLDKNEIKNFIELRYARFKLEVKFGRILKENEITHHNDGNKLNDKIINLSIKSVYKHNHIHHYGKKISEETKIKMSRAKSGKNHPMYGKHLSEETKRKISEAFDKIRMEHNRRIEEKYAS